MWRLGFALVLICLPYSAKAKSWTIDYEHSQLDFVGTEGDKNFNGSFRHFSITVDFDPSSPEKGAIKAIIDTASATAGNKDRDDYLPQKEWFDTKQFSQAVFTSTHIYKTQEGYAAEGILTIKSIARPVTIDFALTQESDHTHIRGKTNLNRSEFKVGDNEWNNENYVKFPVVIIVDLMANAVP